jgi:predicted DCC family thiol-disulfide oxidoreductase YuxK
MDTLLYDRDCGFCQTVLGALLMRDRGGVIRPVPLQEALAADLLDDMEEKDRFASFHYVTDEGLILSGGKALPVLFRQLPALRPLGIAMGAAQPLTDAAYKAVSANRWRIGPHVPASWRDRARATIRRREQELGGDPLEGAEEELEQAERAEPPAARG